MRCVRSQPPAGIPAAGCTSTGSSWVRVTREAASLPVLTSTGGQVEGVLSVTNGPPPSVVPKGTSLRDFPKGANLRVHSAEDLTAVEVELDNRPRELPSGPQRWPHWHR